MSMFRDVRRTVYATCILFEEMLMIMWKRKADGIAAYFVLPLRFIKYVLSAAIFFGYLGHRAYMTFLVVAWFHRVDDVIDGDAPLPHGWSRSQYCAQKQRLIDAVSHGLECDDLLYEDLLLINAIKTARRVGVSIPCEVRDIWSVLMWELSLRTTRRLPLRAEIVDQTTLLDQAVLRFAVKAGRGDVDRYDVIAQQFTGVFTRTDWLNDMVADLRHDIVKLPLEAVTVYGVDLADVSMCASWDALMEHVSFRSWYKDEVARTSSEWDHVKMLMGDNFGGVFASRFTAWIAHRLAVRKLIIQFEHTARRAQQ